MPQSPQKKHLDPFTVVAGVVCTVIGVGIFYKNDSVFTIAGNNWKTVIFAWLLVAFICICTAFSYSRIALYHPTDLGFCGWASPVINQKFSNFFSQLFILFKLGISIPAYCFYASSTFLKILPEDKKLLSDGAGSYSTFGIVALLGLFILIGIILFNYLKPDLAIKAQKLFFYCKFIPIFIAVIFGLLISVVNWKAGLFSSSPQIMKKGGITENAIVSDFSFQRVILAVPGIMFAFDAFLNAGFFSKRLQNPRKSLPRIYMVTICIFTSLYLIITLNQLLNGTGSIHEIFNAKNLWGSETASRIIQGIFLTFIFLSALGLVNGYANTAPTIIGQAFKDDVFYMKRYFLKKFKNEKKAIFMFWIMVTSFWTTVMLSASAATNSDAFFDGLTNIPSLFIFAVYGVLAGAYAYRKWQTANFRKANVSEKKELILVSIASSIAAFSWVGIVLFQFIHLCLYRPVRDFNGVFEVWNGPWGTNGTQIRNWQAALIMLICLTSIFVFYYVDKMYKKKEMSGLDCWKLGSKRSWYFSFND
ncbi:APC family permease [Candidatus Mycoplasma haematohominis]|uniref:APC family permease n=1 Tax=Candidatus Mycoplasma haematohominis TaxID=1494318 RepID=UPI001C0A715B|nr:APC family permease [Candidatus Mycoplasma haemohominis]